MSYDHALSDSRDTENHYPTMGFADTVESFDAQALLAQVAVERRYRLPPDGYGFAPSSEPN